jgi:tRNA threonylcarbamoyl adenosine modification protein YjeE
MPPKPADNTFRVTLADEAATALLAQDVAAVLAPGDLIALSGRLGSGKTSFARALLRALAGNPALEVQSPTFPLRIDHALPRFPVVHADLYRLGSAEELTEIGLEEALADGAALVEWPEKLPADMAANRLDLAFAIEGRGRSVEISGTGSSPERLARSRKARAFLEASGWHSATRTRLAGDASYRAYERVAALSPPLRGRDGEGANVQGATLHPSPLADPPPQGGREMRAILMNAPARTEGLPIYEGRSYDAIAHRARDVRAFVAIANTLREAGIRAPEVLAADLDAGLLLLENLGSESIVDPSGAPIIERYEAAIDLLAFMHARRWPEKASLPGGESYEVPLYDRDALLIEISLFPDWFGGHGGEPRFPAAARDEFLSAWSRTLDEVDASTTTWVMRDFHSPNILWQTAATGIRRVGVIDFQDSLIGHPAYDVASLAQDARVPLSAEQENGLRERYIAARQAQASRFDSTTFEAAYAILGLQRATKVLGIFTRLAMAEGKPGYQRHRARLKELIRRNLAHPVLSGLRLWYEPYV